MSCQIWQQVDCGGKRTVWAAKRQQGEHDSSLNSSEMNIRLNACTFELRKMMKKTLSKRGRVKIATERW